MKHPEPVHLRHVLIGDGNSPHLLKWARALAPHVELWVASSRGFLPGFDGVVPSWRRLALGADMDHKGGNVGVLRSLPRLGAWLRAIDADWIHAHYLTSHGTLAWLAKRLWGLRGHLIGSAWGSDILVTPQRSALYRWLTGRVLRACRITTSDSHHMAQVMKTLGASEVSVFPFGLERLPPAARAKEPWLFFTNRGMEPIYRPERVISTFAAISAANPEARLVVANHGSLRGAMDEQVFGLGLQHRVLFVGRLDASAQDRWYARATWYLSLPESDSVAVSVLEAMGHSCIPILSDLPANHELVEHGENGLILAEDALPDMAQLAEIGSRAEPIGRHNRTWVQQHGLFAPAVRELMTCLRTLAPSPRHPSKPRP